MKYESTSAGQNPEGEAPRKLRLSEMVAKKIAEGGPNAEDAEMLNKRRDMAIARLEQRRQIKPAIASRPQAKQTPSLTRRKSYVAHVHDAIQEKEDAAFDKAHPEDAPNN